MAATPESKVKAKIKAILKAHGAYYAMPIGTGYGSSGIPDFLVCFNGEFLAIEAKAGKGKTTALQEREIDAIRTAKGLAFIINEDNMHNIKELLQWNKDEH